MIITQSLPGIKRFLRPLSRKTKPLVMLVRLLAAFVSHMGRMSASQAGEAIRTQACHRGNVGRFLEHSKWLKAGLLRRLARPLVQAELRRGGEWTLLIDSTFCGHQGHYENTFSCGNYRKRTPQSNRRQRKTARRSAHGFVMALLLTPRGVRLPFFLSYLTREYCLRHGHTYRTQAELAAELIRVLPLPESIRVTVLGDTAFDAKVIRAACAERGYRWIVPLNPERRLAGASPRSQVSSLIASLKARDLTPVRLTTSQGPLAAQHRAARCRCGSRNYTRTFYVHGERRGVHRVGDVLLVFSTREKPHSRRAVAIQKVLMTNAVSLSPREVVRWYALRWQIELFFKELKSVLGLDHYQFRRFVPVERFVTACLITFLYLEWCRWRRLRQRGLPRQERERCAALRTYGLCRLIRQQTEDNDLRYIVRSCRTPSGLRKLRQTLCRAIPHEYQTPTYR